MRKVIPNLSLRELNAAEWRYQRYIYEQYLEGKEPLPFEVWKSRYYDTLAEGGRPGRPGGPVQRGTRLQLEIIEGWRNVENVKLGNNYPDMVNPKPNDKGGTDYIEVGKMTLDGKPVAREREKLAQEILALGENDTLTFIDEADPARRITYRRGDDAETKFSQ
jgi:hypothetical protein